MRLRTQLLQGLVVVSGLLLVSGIVVGGPAWAANETGNSLNGTGTEANPYVITNADDLDAIRDDLDGYYVLGTDIDATETAEWEAGAGFHPIGNENNMFSGTIDGQNHTVKGLTIRQPGEDEVGFISYSNGIIKNIHFEAATVRGERVVGIVVGENHGPLTKVSATGSVRSDKEEIVGGLIGYNGGGTIEQMWGNVDVINSGTQTGGLIGSSYGPISNSYARGSVSAEGAGGVVGDNGKSIQYVYSTGRVTGDDPGGLVWWNKLIVDSYWNVETSGQSRGAAENNAGGTGLTTDEMTGPDAKQNMDAFDFEDIWATTDSYPILRWQIESFDIYSQQIIQVNDSTTLVTKLDLIGERTESVNSVANFESSDSLIATIDDRTVTAESEGRVDITATHADRTATTSVLIISNEGISAIDAETEDDEVEANETITVTGTFRNVDANATHRNISLTANGETVATQNVSVNASSDATHIFEWTPESAGNYDLTLDGLNAGSVEVTPEPTPTPTEEPTSTESSEQTTEHSDGTTEASDGTTATGETVPMTEENQDDNSEETPSTNADDESGLPTGPLVGGVAIVAVIAGVIVGRRV